LGKITFSILNVSRTSSRIYVHNLIPLNTSNNIINSNFIVHEKYKSLESANTSVHYNIKEKDAYNLTYSKEVPPNQVKQLIAIAMAFDSLINEKVKLRISQALNKSLY
jgi:hypothetical protein